MPTYQYYFIDDNGQLAIISTTASDNIYLVYIIKDGGKAANYMSHEYNDAANWMHAHGHGWRCVPEVSFKKRMEQWAKLSK